MTSSIATQSDDQLGGSASVLVRQKRDHVELDRLLQAIDTAVGSEREELLNRLCRLVFPHAFAEESVLWPAIRSLVADGEQLTLRIEREHQEINARRGYPQHPADWSVNTAYLCLRVTSMLPSYPARLNTVGNAGESTRAVGAM